MNKILKSCSCMMAILLICFFLLTPIYAANIENNADSFPADAKTISENPLTDNLEDQTDTNWYRFDFIENGDALLLIKALQDTWGGYTYYWKATVYRSDMTTVVAESNIEGYQNLTAIPLNNIEADTYFLHVTPVNTANPLMSGFTTDPYEITLFSFYESYTPEFEDDGVQIFDKKYQVIGKIKDTHFIKIGEGTAYGAFYRNDEGAVIPMLVSETPNAVNYIVSSTGQNTTPTNSTSSLQIDGKTYYYTNAHWIDRYTSSWQSEKSANYLFIEGDGDSAVAEKILKEIEKSEKGLFLYVVSNYWYWPLIVIIAIGCLVVSSWLQYDGPA